MSALDRLAEWLAAADFNRTRGARLGMKPATCDLSEYPHSTVALGYGSTLDDAIYQALTVAAVRAKK